MTRSTSGGCIYQTDCSWSLRHSTCSVSQSAARWWRDASGRTLRPALAGRRWRSEEPSCCPSQPPPRPSSCYPPSRSCSPRSFGIESRGLPGCSEQMGRFVKHLIHRGEMGLPWLLCSMSNMWLRRSWLYSSWRDSWNCLRTSSRPPWTSPPARLHWRPLYSLDCSGQRMASTLGFPWSGW